DVAGHRDITLEVAGWATGRSAEDSCAIAFGDAVYPGTVTPLLAIDGGNVAARIQFDTGNGSELGRVGFAVHPFTADRTTKDAGPVPASAPYTIAVRRVATGSTASIRLHSAASGIGIVQPAPPMALVAHPQHAIAPAASFWPSTPAVFCPREVTP